MKQAMFYKKIGEKDNIIQCELCPWNCVIADRKRGKCGVRENRKGTLYSLVFGKPCSMSVDPVEKKPFFHFAPGSKTLSVATVGCNLSCSFCQNFEISQTDKIFGDDVSPEMLAELGREYSGFSWTYTEPTIFYEYFYETAKLARKKNMDTYHTWVSNGYTNPVPIEKTAGLLDAVNIDYKGNSRTYRELCFAKLEPVQTAMVLHKKQGTWVEITNLVIPGYNDKDEQIKEMVQWVLDNLGQVPMHFSRFHPMHKLLDVPATPKKTLEKAVKIAEDMGVNYVYVGNIRHDKESTFCHNCRHPVIKRTGYQITKMDLNKKGKTYHCPECLTKIPLAGMEWSSFKKEQA